MTDYPSQEGSSQAYPQGTYPQGESGNLEKRLQVAEDRLAILELEGVYGYAYDSCQGELWASLFTEDGIYQGRQLPGMPQQNFIQGRDNLARFCEEQPSSGMHLMHIPHIRLDGDEATSRIHLQVRAMGIDSHNRGHLRDIYGYYDVAYSRTPTGWKIKRRITTYMDITQHTAFGYEPVPANLEGTPPDNPYIDTRN